MTEHVKRHVDAQDIMRTPVDSCILDVISSSEIRAAIGSLGAAMVPIGARKVWLSNTGSYTMITHQHGKRSCGWRLN